LQVPFFFRLEMTHWPDMRNVSGARQMEHWRLRGGAGGRAILASVGLGRVPGWQYWHSGRAAFSGDTMRVGIRQLEQNWVSAIVVWHHDRGRRMGHTASAAVQRVPIVVQVTAAIRA
jgi:hypothetical protein